VVSVDRKSGGANFYTVEASHHPCCFEQYPDSQWGSDITEILKWKPENSWGEDIVIVPVYVQ